MPSEFTPASELETGTDTPPPAQESVTPVEPEEAVSTEAPPAGEGEEVEQTPTSEPTGEPSQQASETEETPSVKAQARKVWAEVNKMGGQTAFDTARSIYDSYFNKTPQDFIADIKQYGAKFYPVRNQLMTDSLREFPEDAVEMIRQLHPDLDIQVGKKGQASQAQATQPADGSAEAELAYAREILADAGGVFTEQDKALARRTIALHEQYAEAQKQLGKLPELEQRFSQFEEQGKAQKVQAAQTKYVDELMESAIDKTYKEAGLEGSPVSLTQFRQLVVAAHGEKPEANARFEAAMDALAQGDERTALLLKEQILRDGEEIAFGYAKAFSAGHAQRLTSKTQQLTQERPKVVPAGAPPGAQASLPPPFDETEYASALKDIKARTA